MQNGACVIAKATHVTCMNTAGHEGLTCSMTGEAPALQSSEHSIRSELPMFADDPFWQQSGVYGSCAVCNSQKLQKFKKAEKVTKATFCN